MMIAPSAAVDQGDDRRVDRGRVAALGTLANTVSAKPAGWGTGAARKPRPKRKRVPLDDVPQHVRERQTRLRRFELQDHAARLAPNQKDRVRACLRRVTAISDAVEVRYSPEGQTAHYRGLQTCGSVWHCPVCAAKISERRRDELAALVKAHIAAGGSVWMTTYTVKHSRFTNLADLVKQFLEARRKMRGGRRGMALRSDFQVIGTVSVLEVTWSSENGWHPHVHELVFSSDQGMDPQAYDEAARPAWRDAATAQGLAMNAHGFQIDRTFGAVADYIAKFGHEPATARPWGVESEVVKGHIKQGRDDEHLTPFALLAAIADGLEALAPRWQEYATVFKGRKQLNYSPGLKKLYQQEEQTDEELAAQGETCEALTLVELLPYQWDVVVEHRVRGGLLELARSGRVGELIEGLAEIGVEVEPVDMQGWRVNTPAGDGGVLSVQYVKQRWRCSVMLDQADDQGRRWQGYALTDVVVLSGPSVLEAVA